MLNWLGTREIPPGYYFFGVEDNADNYSSLSLWVMIVAVTADDWVT